MLQKVEAVYPACMASVDENLFTVHWDEDGAVSGYWFVKKRRTVRITGGNR